MRVIIYGQPAKAGMGYLLVSISGRRPKAKHVREDCKNIAALKGQNKKGHCGAVLLKHRPVPTHVHASTSDAL
jgi:hypothetical protein